MVDKVYVRFDRRGKVRPGNFTTKRPKDAGQWSVFVPAPVHGEVTILPPTERSNTNVLSYVLVFILVVSDIYFMHDLPMLVAMACLLFQLSGLVAGWNLWGRR